MLLLSGVNLEAVGLPCNLAFWHESPRRRLFPPHTRCVPLLVCLVSCYVEPFVLGICRAASFQLLNQSLRNLTVHDVNVTVPREVFVSAVERGLANVNGAHDRYAKGCVCVYL